MTYNDRLSTANGGAMWCAECETSTHNYPDCPTSLSFDDDNRLTRIEEKLDKVLAISERVEAIATGVAGQVKPVLDDLMKSPLLKMLGVKTK